MADNATKRFAQEKPLAAHAITLVLASLLGGGFGELVADEPPANKSISRLSKNVKDLQQEVEDLEKKAKRAKAKTKRLGTKVERLERRR